MGFKQWPSVFAKITPVIYQLKDFKRVWCKRTLSHVVFWYSIGEFFSFRILYEIKRRVYVSKKNDISVFFSYVKKMHIFNLVFYVLFCKCDPYVRWNKYKSHKYVTKSKINFFPPYCESQKQKSCFLKD